MLNPPNRVYCTSSTRNVHFSEKRWFRVRETMTSETGLFCCCNSGRDFDPLHDVCFTVLAARALVSCTRNHYFRPCLFRCAGAVFETCRFQIIRARRSKPLGFAVSFLNRRRDGFEAFASDYSRPPFKNDALQSRGWVSRFAGRRNVFNK